MYIDQDTFVEAEDYQIPAEAIMAPDTIDPFVIGGFSTNLLIERDQLHGVLLSLAEKACISMGLEPECAEDILKALPINNIVDSICKGRYYRSGEWKGFMRTFGIEG